MSVQNKIILFLIIGLFFSSLALVNKAAVNSLIPFDSSNGPWAFDSGCEISEAVEDIQQT